MKKFSSKTNSLILLEKKLKIKNCKIPKFIYFSKRDYIVNKDLIFKKIKRKFKKKIIIRSSSFSEDLDNKTNAGKYKSFLNISIDKKIIFEKINEVINDYKSLKRKNNYSRV